MSYAKLMDSEPGMNAVDSEPGQPARDFRWIDHVDMTAGDRVILGRL